MSRIYVTGLGPGSSRPDDNTGEEGAGKMSGDHRIYSIY